MNELQIFAFFVLPLSIAAVAAIGAYLTHRGNVKRRHHTPAE